MGWYTVTKTIKGNRYTYLQRTWREGGSVRTRSVYVGPVAPAAGRSPAAFHGSRDGIPVGATPSPSKAGVYGSGVYLTYSKRRADLYARYHPKIAADFDRIWGNVGEPEFDGTVDAFDLSGLNLLPIKDGSTYIDLADAAGGTGDLKGYATPTDKVALQELLQARGYDGIQINDPDDHAIVVFRSAVAKLTHVDRVRSPQLPNIGKPRKRVKIRIRAKRKNAPKPFYHYSPIDVLLGRVPAGSRRRIKQRRRRKRMYEYSPLDVLRGKLG